MSDVFPHDECTTCGAKPKFTILLTADAGRDGEAVFHIPNQRVREMQGTSFDLIRQIPFCQDCIRIVEDNLRDTISRLSDGNGKSRPSAKDFDIWGQME